MSLVFPGARLQPHHPCTQPCTRLAKHGRRADSIYQSLLWARLGQQLVTMAVIAQLVARRSHTHSPHFRLSLPSIHAHGLQLSEALGDLAAGSGLFPPVTSPFHNLTCDSWRLSPISRNSGRCETSRASCGIRTHDLPPTEQVLCQTKLKKQ